MTPFAKSHALRLASCLATIVLLTLTAGVQAKGGAAKTSGWSIPGASVGTSSAVPGGATLGGAGGKNKVSSALGLSTGGLTPPSSSGLGMSGMLMTPNGMIVHNTQPMAVANPTNMGGASLVAASSPGIGNSTVTQATRGVGNSQGSGGTMDIAQMTHFGIVGASAVGSMLGGSGLGSLLSTLMAPSAASPSLLKPTPGGQNSAISAMKAQAMGMATNKACVGGSGGKTGC